MGIQTFPAAAAGKTSYKILLTSGTSWTVPTGVNYINVTLFGGGGGGGGAGDTGGKGGTGGSTTFTGATTAAGGTGGSPMSRDTSVAATSANTNSGNGGQGAGILGSESRGYGSVGGQGDIFTSYVTTTPGASIAYAIGAGGTAGSGGTAGTGGSGRIQIEYFA